MKVNFETKRDLVVEHLEERYNKLQRDRDDYAEKAANLGSSIIVGPNQKAEVDRLNQFVDSLQYQIDDVVFQIAALKESVDGLVYCELDV